jgi:ketosteroid isomerase-like protein
MKKIMITGALFLLGLTAFCQQEENGTIYIKHPYIDAVNNATKAYEGQDWAAMKNFYSDTAKWLVSGMPKFIPIADAMKEWKGDFEHFDGVKQVPQGYPDYLHYKKEDAKIVQSWWTWTGKSKKTGEVYKIPMVMFDEFNNDGKIVREYIYGDFSKVTKEAGM